MKPLNWKIFIGALIVLAVVLKIRSDGDSASNTQATVDSSQVNGERPKDSPQVINKPNKIAPKAPKRSVAGKAAPHSLNGLDFESQLRQWSPLSQPKVNRQNGIVRQIYGLSIPLGQTGKFRDVEVFVRELSSELGLGKGEIYFLEQQSDPYSQQHFFAHRIQGYEVFSSVLRVITDLNGGKIMYVTTDLLPVVEYDSTVSIQNIEILERMRSQRPESEVKLLSSNPVYVVNNAGAAELAWRFSIDEVRNQKMTSRELLISTKTGIVLRDMNRLFH